MEAESLLASLAQVHRAKLRDSDQEYAYFSVPWRRG